jgi:hypothetical protein
MWGKNSVTNFNHPGHHHYFAVIEPNPVALGIIFSQSPPKQIISSPIPTYPELLGLFCLRVTTCDLKGYPLTLEYLQKYPATLKCWWTVSKDEVSKEKKR